MKTSSHAIRLSKQGLGKVASYESARHVFTVSDALKLFCALGQAFKECDVTEDEMMFNLEETFRKKDNDFTPPLDFIEDSQII